MTKISPVEGEPSLYYVYVNSNTGDVFRSLVRNKRLDKLPNWTLTAVPDGASMVVETPSTQTKVKTNKKAQAIVVATATAGYSAPDMATLPPEADAPVEVPVPVVNARATRRIKRITPPATV